LGLGGPGNPWELGDRETIELWARAKLGPLGPGNTRELRTSEPRKIAGPATWYRWPKESKLQKEVGTAVWELMDSATAPEMNAPGGKTWGYRPRVTPRGLENNPQGFLERRGA